MKLLLLMGVFLACSLGTLVNAHNKTVVVPLFDDAAKRPANVVVVAKKNGDFTNPVEALESISDASETKPYLVAVAPGNYEISKRIEMKPYVSLVGSGPDLTKLFGSFGGAVIAGADKSTIENLAIDNRGPSGWVIGIYNEGVNNTIENVRVFVRNGQAVNIGIFSTADSFTRIIRSSITAKSGFDDNNHVIAVLFNQSSGIISHSSLTADGADPNLFPRSNQAYSFSGALSGRTYIDNSSLASFDALVDRNINTAGTSVVELSFGNSLFAVGTSIQATGSSKVIVRNSDFQDSSGTSKTVGASIVCLFSTQNTTILNANCN